MKLFDMRPANGELGVFLPDNELSQQLSSVGATGIQTVLKRKKLNPLRLQLATTSAIVPASNHRTFQMLYFGLERRFFRIARDCSQWKWDVPLRISGQSFLNRTLNSSTICSYLWQPMTLLMWRSHLSSG